MSKQTALHQVIEFIEIHGNGSSDKAITVNDVYEFVKSKLPTERENIIDAHLNASQNIRSHSALSFFEEDAEDYFTTTFKQE